MIAAQYTSGNWPWIFLGGVAAWFAWTVGTAAPRNNRRPHTPATRGAALRAVGAEPKPEEPTSSTDVPGSHPYGGERSRQPDYVTNLRDARRRWRPTVIRGGPGR